eukprot:TRINITY_DN2241_c0_g6_i2.p1 TRINITY_DN2241_c0_g6~~TRINITY_DN2241_c0_g6_i2.p1  ORF type:complete len:236 (-),score=50.19 TRINITY_DN2241_c0_g6_i2:102-809(-)
MYETSIQEEIERIVLPIFLPRTAKFHSGGREDIDVRMLGEGRPFVLELIDAKRIPSSFDEGLLGRIEADLKKNPLVNVRGLYMDNEKCFERLKESETEKIKAYACIVHCSRPVKPEDIENLHKVRDLKIAQKTPLRVLHRRTLMIREKIIHRLRAVQLNEQFLIVAVLSSAGTYIKEFVHGDLERTVPNLGTLLHAETDILQLDVLKLYEKVDAAAVDDFDSLPLGDFSYLDEKS